MGRKLVWRSRIGKAASGPPLPIPQNIFCRGFRPPKVRFACRGQRGAAAPACWRPKSSLRDLASRHRRPRPFKMANPRDRPGLAGNRYAIDVREQACPTEPSADVPPLHQAAGLNSFEALLLIGSMVSEAIFWLSSPNSLAWAAYVSACLRVWAVEISTIWASVRAPSNSVA